jgi:prepilin-type N-terminal cleavage/methylation domain-containing protein
MHYNKQGFTAVEIMIVVMVVGLLATLSFPTYQKSRETAQKSVCINTLRLIQDAGDQYLFDHPSLTTMPISFLVPYMKRGEIQECPLKGTYTIEFTTESAATCSFGNGHEL